MKKLKKTMATIISFIMCFTLLTNVAHAEELAPVISDYVEEISSETDEEISSDFVEDISLETNEEIDPILTGTESEEDTDTHEAETEDDNGASGEVSDVIFEAEDSEDESDISDEIDSEIDIDTVEEVSNESDDSETIDDNEDDVISADSDSEDDSESDIPEDTETDDKFVEETKSDVSSDADNADADETELSEFVSTEEISLSFEDTSTEDELILLEEYISNEVDKSQTPVFYSSTFAGSKLTGINKKIYDKAKIAIAEVANGERKETTITIPFGDLGCSGLFTAQELGVSEIIAGGEISQNDKDALDNFTGMASLDLEAVYNALCADCPYERYWMGLSTSVSGYSYTAAFSGGQWRIGYAGELVYGISVSADYVGEYDFTVNTSKTKAVNSAIDTINSILDTAENKTDDEKISYFRDTICDLNSYNYEVLSWTPQETIDNYGDPWQLVYVFDGDPDTKTVCEGYSKAFMFLCNKTFFSSSAINCYSVSGDMDGEAHMWNIIHWSDNKNYLVDVTNCDSLGNNDLFKATPVSGTYAAGYTFQSGTNEYLYTYDDDTKETYSEKELTFDIEVYDALTGIIVNYDAYIVCNKSIPFTVVRQGGSDDCQFSLDSAVDSSSASILGDYTPSYGNDNVFYITFPSEGKYTITFSAKDTDETVKSDTITVDVKKGTGITTYNELSNALSSASIYENDPTLIKLDADIYATSMLTVYSDTYVILDLNGHVLSGNGSNRVIQVNGNLTIIDSNPTATHNPEITYISPVDDTETITVNGGVIKDGNKSNGGAIYINPSGNLTLEGGNVTLNYSDYGGGIYVDGGGFVMNGGSVCGNTAQYNGGGIYINNNNDYDGNAIINGGYVSYNKINAGDGDGGGLHVRNSTLTFNAGEINNNLAGAGGGISMYNNAHVIMNGGTISHNKGTLGNCGAGVSIYACPSFDMNGGEISENTAVNGNGGGVRLRNTTFNMSGDAVIKDNTANTDGGGICVYYGTAPINMSENASIKDNTASGSGGGVYYGSVVMTDNASIENNEANGSGGGICISDSVTMSGNTSVDNNICHGGRGGAGIVSSVISISGKASVSGNRFEQPGYYSWGGAGGIYSEGTVTMTGGIISNNYSDADGGGIGLYYSGVLNMSGGSIVNNYAVRRGGGVYQPGDYGGHIEVSGTPVIMNNTQGTDNIAGNVYYMRNDMVRVTGSLEEGARIGITTRNNPANGSPATVTSLNANENFGYSLFNNDDPNNYFVSDAGFFIFLDDTGEARAATPWQYIGIRLNNGETVILTEDVKAMSCDNYITIDQYTTAILDLNGHIIDGCGLSDNVFYFWGSEKNLTIIDSNPDAQHTPAVTYTDPVTKENVTVNGGIITGARNCGVMAAYGSTINMKGGSIVGNNMGVSMRGSVFNLEGGSICGNISNIDGGGVWVYEAATLNMTGGSITGNTTSGKGGGVYLYNNQSNSSVLNLRGGSITNNVCAENRYGGAVAIDSRGYLNISGNPFVKGNKKGVTDDNISGLFSIDGEMTSGAHIEITYGIPELGNYNNFANNYLTYNPDVNPNEYFYPVNEGGFVGLHDKDAALYANNQISFIANGGSGNMESIYNVGGNFTLPENGFTAPYGKRFRIWKVGNREYAPGASIYNANNTSIIAQWEDIPLRTVTYNVNGGNAITPNVYNIYEGYEYGEMPEPVFTGYVFDGWYTLSEGGDKVVSTDICNGDITLYAHYSYATDTDYKVEHYLEKIDGSGFVLHETDNLKGQTNTSITPAVKDYAGFTAPDVKTDVIKADGSTVVEYEYTRKSFILTWDLGGGTAAGDYTTGAVKYGAVIVEPSLTRPGYTFDGWEYGIPDSMPAADLTIKANWTAKTDTPYKVYHFLQDLNGEYSLDPEIESFTGTTDESVTPELKSFEGFTAPSAKTEVIAGDGSLMVDYLYTRNSYEITWDFAGGNASGNYTKGYVKFDETIITPAPVKTGYAFAGWDTAVPDKMPAGNLTFKAKWKAKTDTAYKVEHYKQGLDGKYTAKPAVENLKGKTGASIKPAVKTYSGFKSPSVKTATIKADGSLVVKYYYTRNTYVLKWDYAGGKANGSYTSGKVKYGAQITAPKPTRTGYTFNGWDATVPKTMPAKNVTYKAKWKINSYTLTWDLAGGTAGNKYTSGKVKYNTKITAPVPTKEGYVFTGWSVSVPKNMPAKNLKIKAKWREKTQEEYVTEFVKRFYSVVLERPQAEIDADVEGIQYWVDRLITGVDDGSNVAYGFVYSQEFQNKKVSDEEYVIILYHSFFGRDPFDPNNLDVDGYNYWLNKLKNGTDRMDVLAGFTNSVEFQNLCDKYRIKRGKLVPSEKDSYRRAHNLP